MADRSWDARRRRRRAWTPAVALALAATTAQASDSNATGPVALEWVAPDGCPDAGHVEQTVTRLLSDRSPSGGPYLTARAEVQEDESGAWSLELRTTGRDGSGVRRVSAESCRALADATALILALAIDPTLPAANGASERTATPAQPVVEPAAFATRTSLARPAVRFAVDASAVVDVGTLPVVAPGVAATLAAIPGALPALRVEIGAGLFLDEAATSPPARSGTFSLRVFGASGCLVAPARRWEIGACAGAELAWMAAEGLYESTLSRVQTEWAVLRAKARVAYRLSSAWAVRADVGAGLDMSRPEFMSGGYGHGLIFRPARCTGRGTLGLELRF